MPSPQPFSRWKAWARRLKVEVLTLYLAGRDPRLPWSAKAFAALVAAYALSPVDLIPDFIPVLGYLDDLLLLPLGVWLALRMIPPEVAADCRTRAQELAEAGAPLSRWGAALIVALWLAAAAGLLLLLRRRL